MTPPSPLKVLVAIDDDEPSQDAIAFAERHLPPDAEVLVLNNVATQAVTTGWSVLGPAPVQAAAQVRTVVRSHAHELATTAADALPQDAEATVQRGDPAVTICAVAEDNGIDLIVVGTRDRNMWSRLWFGSVSRHVATHAPCSVLIVR